MAEEPRAKPELLEWAAAADSTDGSTSMEAFGAPLSDRDADLSVSWQPSSPGEHRMVVQRGPQPGVPEAIRPDVAGLSVAQAEQTIVGFVDELLAMGLVAGTVELRTVQAFYRTTAEPSTVALDGYRMIFDALIDGFVMVSVQVELRVDAAGQLSLVSIEDRHVDRVGTFTAPLGEAELEALSESLAYEELRAEPGAIEFEPAAVFVGWLGLEGIGEPVYARRFGHPGFERFGVLSVADPNAGFIRR